MSRVLSFLWSWCKPIVIAALTIFVSFRISTICLAEHTVWYDGIIFILGILVISGIGGWYVSKTSPRLAVTTVGLLVGISAVGGILSAMDMHTESLIVLCLYGTFLGIGLYSWQTTREKARTFEDVVEELYWQIDQIEQVAIYRQKPAAKIRKIQEARCNLFPLTGMTSYSYEVPENLERIQERLDEAKTKRESD